MFIDCHAHIYDLNTDEVLKRAKSALVDFVICPSTSPQTIVQSVALSERYENVFACIGFHPEDIQKFGKSEEKMLFEMARHKKVVGVGEIGLDYHFGGEDKILQKRAFERQIEIAHALKKPVVIHIRDAFDDGLEILTRRRDCLLHGGLIHCFSGNIEQAKKYMDLGLSFTIGGICTFKNSKDLQEAIKQIPLDRILLETDTPYLAPEPFRGQVNEPKNIPFIAEKIACLKNVPVEQVAAVTTQNARRMFGI